MSDSPDPASPQAPPSGRQMPLRSVGPAAAALVVVLDRLIDQRRRAAQRSGEPAHPVSWFAAGQQQKTSSEQARWLRDRFAHDSTRHHEAGTPLLHAVAHSLDHICYERGLTPQDFSSGLGDASELRDALVAAAAETARARTSVA